jgi:hypothetical protein
MKASDLLVVFPYSYEANQAEDRLKCITENSRSENVEKKYIRRKFLSYKY